MLTPEQKFTWKVTSHEMMTLFDEDPEDFLLRIVTQDETWVPHFDPEAPGNKSLLSVALHPFFVTASTTCEQTDTVLATQQLELN